jgi:hypothetical protein
MAFQHFVAAGRADENGLLIFIPPGTVAVPQRFALGLRLLVNALPDNPRVSVATVEAPAKLVRNRQAGVGVFSVVSQMQLIVTAEPDR